MTFDYPEIEQLNKIYVEHKFTSSIDRSQLLAGQKYYPLVHFTLGGEAFSVFVDDEYDDLRNNYPLLNLCLILRELEGYDFSREYEVWCQERGLDPEIDRVKDNFKHLGEVYRAIEKILGEVDSKVSDFDFEMNARAAQKLRRSK